MRRRNLPERRHCDGGALTVHGASAANAVAGPPDGRDRPVKPWLFGTHPIQAGAAG